MARRGILDTGVGIPAFSYVTMSKGTKFGGIQVGELEDNVPQTDMKGNPLYYPIRGSKTKENPEGTPDLSSPKEQGIITLLTEYRNWEWTSDSFKEKAEADPTMVDDGRRRLYIKGSLSQPNTRKGLIDALRKAGAKAPEHGAVHELTVTGKTQLGEGGKATNFTYVYKLPTPATLAAVEHLKPEPPAASSSVLADVEPDDEDPPF